MKHLLIPTDFSKTALNALEYALELGRVFGADCTLVHAWEMPYDFASQLDNRIGSIERAARDKLDELVKQVRKEARYEQLVLGYKLEEGKPERVIIDLAEETDTDLIVMGLSQNSGMETFLSGNTATEVLDHSKVPVLAIPSGTEYLKPREIIYASDFREDDIRRLENLSLMAKQFNARLRILHIEEGNSYEEKMRFRGFIEEVEDRLSYPYVSQELRTAEKVEKGILKAVEETEGVILAMAHGHKPMLKKIFGHSHTLSIATKIKVPLLVYGKQQA